MHCKKEAPSGRCSVINKALLFSVFLIPILIALLILVGLYRNTLWKRVQAVVVPLLAQLVSVIDRDQNLNILLDGNCGESVKRLWLDIFDNEKLLEIPRLTLDHK